jgi:anti-sigma factor RsiW
VLTCEELTAFLDDYVAGEQPADVRARFEEHLAVCPPCVDYLAGYRAAISLGRQAYPSALAGGIPDDVPEELVKAIVAARDARN